MALYRGDLELFRRILQHETQNKAQREGKSKYNNYIQLTIRSLFVCSFIPHSHTLSLSPSLAR